MATVKSRILKYIKSNAPVTTGEIRKEFSGYSKEHISGCIRSLLDGNQIDRCFRGVYNVRDKRTNTPIVYNSPVPKITGEYYLVRLGKDSQGTTSISRVRTEPYNSYQDAHEEMATEFERVGNAEVTLAIMSCVAKYAKVTQPYVINELPIGDDNA